MRMQINIACWGFPEALTDSSSDSLQVLYRGAIVGQGKGVAEGHKRGEASWPKAIKSLGRAQAILLATPIMRSCFSDYHLLVLTCMLCEERDPGRHPQMWDLKIAHTMQIRDIER